MSKDFDAVELVRKIRDDMYEETKDMSAPELVEFFRRHGSAAKERLNQIRKEREAVPQGKDDHPGAG